MWNLPSGQSPPCQLTLPLLNDLHQEPEGRVVARLRVHEEHRGSARALARRLVDDVEALRLHVVERLLDVRYAEGHVSEASPAAVAVDELLHGRVRGERLEQLDQVRA